MGWTSAVNKASTFAHLRHVDGCYYAIIVHPELALNRNPKRLLVRVWHQATPTN